MRRKPTDLLFLNIGLMRQNVRHQGQRNQAPEVTKAAENIPLSFTKMAPAAADAFLLIPAAVLTIKHGIESINRETAYKIAELKEIEEQVTECIKRQREIKLNAQGQAEPKDMALYLESTSKLQQLLHEVADTKASMRNAEITKYPLVIMLCGALSYEMKAIIDMTGAKINGVNQGVGDVSIGGSDAALNAGALGAAGNSLLFASELVMAVRTTIEIVRQFEENSNAANDIKTIKRSKQISGFAKEMVVSAKRDKKNLAMVNMLGNVVSVFGEIAMATGGPVGIGNAAAFFTGLGVTMAGNAMATAAETISEGRHKFDKTLSEIDEKISAHYMNRIISSYSEESSTDEVNYEEEYGKVMRDRAFTNELLLHLSSTTLALNKVFKEGNQLEKTVDDKMVNDAFSNAKRHYSGRAYQKHLFDVVERLEGNSRFTADLEVKSNSDDKFRNARIAHDASVNLPLKHVMKEAKAAGDNAYFLLQEKLVSATEVKPEDHTWIISLGEGLAKLEASATSRSFDIGIFDKMAEIKDLPPTIAENLKQFKIYNSGKIQDMLTEKTLYKNVIAVVQESFLADRLKDMNVTKTEILAQSEEQRATNLKDLFDKSNVAQHFAIIALNQQEKNIFSRIHKKLFGKGEERDSEFANPNYSIEPNEIEESHIADKSNVSGYLVVEATEEGKAANQVHKDKDTESRQSRGEYDEYIEITAEEEPEIIAQAIPEPQVVKSPNLADAVAKTVPAVRKIGQIEKSNRSSFLYGVSKVFGLSQHMPKNKNIREVTNRKALFEVINLPKLCESVQEVNKITRRSAASRAAAQLETIAIKEGKALCAFKKLNNTASITNTTSQLTTTASWVSRLQHDSVHDHGH